MTAARKDTRPRKKLDWPQVREIRALAASQCLHCGRPLTGVELARQFSVSAVMVHKVLTNKSWRIEDDPLYGGA